VIAFIINVALFLLFCGKAMTGARLNGGRMGSVSWMWIPAVVFLGFGIYPGWAIFGKK
jgi:hypothetical protein